MSGIEFPEAAMDLFPAARRVLLELNQVWTRFRVHLPLTAPSAGLAQDGAGGAGQ